MAPRLLFAKGKHSHSHSTDGETEVQPTWCFKREHQIATVNMDFHRIGRKLSTAKKEVQFVGKVLHDLSRSHHAVPWPPEDATWLLPHHLQANTLLHIITRHYSKQRTFPLLSFSRLPPPQMVARSLWWRVSFEQLGQRDLQDSPSLLHNRGANAGDEQS